MFKLLTENRKKLFIAPVLALSIGLASCGGNDTTTTTPTTGGSPTTPTSGGGGGTVSLNGSGASFPAPLYQRWFSDYNKNVDNNVQVSYQSVGSGAGVENFIQGIVDFGASDVAMTDEEIAKVENGVVLLPMAAGAIVLAYNLDGVDNLQLSRETYANILLGKITKWNDPAIQKDNQGVDLPDENITVIYRSDGSGTTGVFTKHLSSISSEWESSVGEGKSVSWPVGVGAKGNEGVAAQITQTGGSIGYLEFGYAEQLGISYASLENQSGNFVKATSETTSETLKAVELPDNLRAFITDPEGDNSYPIVTYTWILAYQQYDDPAKKQALIDVMTWALENGQQTAQELGYIPLPENVIEKVEEKMATITAN